MQKTFKVFIFIGLMFLIGLNFTGCTNNPPPGGGYRPPPSTDPYNPPSKPPTTDPYSNPSNTDPYSNPSNTDPYSNPSSNYRIDINTAGHSQLESLPGIGPVLADEIINYRFFYGPFRTPSDIIKVRGIGEAKYQAIKHLITTSSSSSTSYYHAPTPPAPNTDPYATGSSNKLNINIATQQELEALPGIGPAKARAIIDYRTRYGKFSKKEDIKKVSGIGDATFNQIKAYIVARGGAVTSNELDLAYRNYNDAYKRFQAYQNDPYASYSEMRKAYDDYIAAKKEYDRLVEKYNY